MNTSKNLGVYLSTSFMKLRKTFSWIRTLILKTFHATQLRHETLSYHIRQTQDAFVMHYPSMVVIKFKDLGLVRLINQTAILQ